jgi:hypothetical protein
VALILGVSTGSKVYLNDKPVDFIEAELGCETMTVSFDGGPDIIITEEEATEVMPQVYLSIGRGKHHEKFEVTVPRVCISAPRDVVILRSELYDEQIGS